jgi:4-carboxymuconolactone decarboxylase
MAYAAIRRRSYFSTRDFTLPKKISKRKQSQAFKAGIAVRRRVVGDAYVDRALAAADELTWPLQELVTEFCWGKIWTRPQLTPRERSLLTLGMLTALNRPHEVRIHVQGALNNGLSREEIIEVFLQAGVYCGVPAAVDSVRIAQELFASIDGKTPTEKRK